jgi:integrase/recombinase XerD
MSRLADAVVDYLAARRALGFKLERHESFLGELVGQLNAAGTTVLRVDDLVAWATSPANADPYWWASRLSVARGFARWWSAFDPATEIPGPDVLPVRATGSQRADPYPFTNDDIAALMAAARTISSPLRAATYETFIGLLAVTGMRVGEVIRLDNTDLNTSEQTLTVRDTKFGKTRLVALHASTITALNAYTNQRHDLMPRPSTSALFVSSTGTRLIYQNVHYEWFGLCHLAGLEPLSKRCRPRPHDLRHRFAINTLIDWHQQGENVHARLPELSTYLGHIAPSSTYWYLRAVPELMALAADRLEPGTQP